MDLQEKQDKYIFHNYGHGGAGWTFLFGAVNQSLTQFDQAVAQKFGLKKSPIAVIGAGCYGLLTAITLARKGYQVRIIAQETERLPSSKAAGFFFPRARKCSTAQEKAVFESQGMHSYQTYLQIYAGNHPFIKMGARLLPAYYGLDIDPGFAPYINKELMPIAKPVIIDFNNGKTYDAMRYEALFIDAALMMQELERNRVELAIPIIRQEITDFNEIPESLIFNCAGLGAKALTHDTKIIPVQGHLISLKNQPPLDYMLNFKVIQKNPLGRPRDELIYFAPKNEGILGITFLRNQADPQANLHEFERLLDRCKEFFGT